MKIFLFGWNNHWNIGDDLMTIAITEFYGKKNVKVIRTGPRDILGAEQFGFGLTFMYRYGLLRRNLIKLNLGYAAARGQVVFGGGNIFESKSQNRLFYRLFRLGAFFNKDSGFSLLNIGFPTSIENDFYLKRMIFEASLIRVRDEYSSNILMQLDVEHDHTPDIVLPFLKNSDIKKSTKSGKLGLIPRAGADLSLFKSFIEENGNNFTEIEIYQCCNSTVMLENDELYLKKLEAFVNAKNVKCRVIYYSGSYVNWLTALAECQIVVSQRLHGMVCAEALGVPWKGISYHNKCVEFAKLPTIRHGELL